MNKFDQLVNDLKTGVLVPSHLRQALKVYFRDHHDFMPEEMKTIVSGGPNGGGLINRHWNLMMETIGNLELLYRRTKDK